jgi:predicted lipoprotein with Yx(FWY)xxD motif
VKRLIHRSTGAAAMLLLLAVSACGGGGSDEPETPGAGQAAASTVETTTSEYGTILTDAEGMTLYMFDPDADGKSTCDAECLQAWPVFPAPAKAGQGVDASLLGTTKATDGTTMATYNGWPLYYWVDDTQPGDVTGQAVGDVWWVMGPDGTPIREKPQAAASDDSAPAPASTVRVAQSELGRILVDAKGMTLYMFDPDQRGGSVCDAECLQAWPVVQGPAQAGQGVDDSLLGTTKATDGTTMATYNGWPLYYFVQDRGAGDVTGQGASDVWWVMSPDGKPMRQLL